jgi:uncharacterized membrane protein YhhN
MKKTIKMINQSILPHIDMENRSEIPLAPKPKGLLAFFWVFVLIDMVAYFGDFLFFHISIKPLLIPILILFLYFYPISVKDGKKTIILGLIFSWLGDTLLIFENFNSLFFILSLLFFLAANITYTYYFLSINQTSPYAISFIHKQPWWISIIILYGCFFIWLIFPYLQEAKVPIIIYAAVICTMLISTLHIFNRINKPTNCRYILSALLFLLSSSLFAINKFYYPIPYCGAFVLLTYAAGQFFIIKGFTEIVEMKGFYKQ